MCAELMSACKNTKEPEKNDVEKKHVLDNNWVNFIINVGMCDSYGDQEYEDQDADGSGLLLSLSDSD